MIYPVSENISKIKKKKKVKEVKVPNSEIGTLHIYEYVYLCDREKYLQYTVYKCPVNSADMSTWTLCVYKSGVVTQSYTIVLCMRVCLSACVVFRTGLRWRCRRRPLLPPARLPPPRPPLSLCFSSAQKEKWTNATIHHRWVKRMPKDQSLTSWLLLCFSLCPHLILVLQQISLLLWVVQLLALSVPFQAVLLLAGGRWVKWGHFTGLWFGALHVWIDSGKMSCKEEDRWMSLKVNRIKDHKKDDGSCRGPSAF